MHKCLGMRVFTVSLLALILAIFACGCGKDSSPTATTATIPEETKPGIAFNWVYQPDGSTSFQVGTISGTSFLQACTEEDSSACDLAGFDFAQKSRIYIGQSDMYFGNYESYPNTLWANNGNGGIRDMGNIPLENLVNAPFKSIGPGASQYHREQPVEAIEGHTYCIITDDGEHYAKIRVTDVSLSQAN